MRSLFSRWAPTICAADASTRSQLLIQRVLEIQPVNRATAAFVGVRVLLYEDEQRKLPLLVPLRPQQAKHVVAGQIRVRARDASKVRYRDAQKSIALAVVARSGLEEPPVHRGTPGARHRAKIPPDATNH